MKLIGFAIYLGIGAMLHAFFVGPTFDWSSATTFGWLLGWPIMLLIAGVFFFVGLAAFVCVVALGIWLWELTWPWRQKRAMKRAHDRIKAKRGAA